MYIKPTHSKPTYRRQTGLTLINQMLLIGALGIVLALIVNHFWKKSSAGKTKDQAVQTQKTTAPTADRK